jgi:hypothetical protein
MAGKGDRRRPTNETKYSENYDRIFKVKKPNDKKYSTPKGK